MAYKSVVECCRNRFEDSNTHLRFENGIRTGVKLFFGGLIQRKEITLYMNLKWNLRGILEPKIDNE